jgi:hypothetical protein
VVLVHLANAQLDYQINCFKGKKLSKAEKLLKGFFNIVFKE